MTGSLREKILKWVSCYTPLHSDAGLAISALLSSHSTAEYGYLGYLVLLIQKQGMSSLRTSVALANVQKGSQALLRFLLVYAAAFRMGLVRMTLYSFAIFIAGSQLLWISPCKGTGPYFAFSLLLLTVGYAGGEGSASCILRTQVIRAQKKEQRKTPDQGSESECTKGPKPPKEGSSGGSGVTGTLSQPGRGAGERCSCHIWREPPPARESCVCFFSEEQCNWRLHVRHIRDIEEATEGGRSCCYHPELNGKKKKTENEGPKQDKNDSSPPGIYYCRERIRGSKREQEMRNRTRVQLFAGKLPGAAAGTVLAAIFSSELEIFFKISTAVTVISYNVFFWMGAQCYELDEMENYDIMDEEDEKQIPDNLVPELKEAVKVLLKLLPLWLTFASTSYLVDATATSFFMEQVDYLENNTQSSKIPKSVFYFIQKFVSFLTGRVCYYLIQLYDDEEKEARWARLIRISIGMLFSSLCCMVASLVAHRLYCNYNSASMFWLLPQFLLWGMMKGIMKEGLEEFLYDHLDNERQVKAVCRIAESLGNFLGAILTAGSPSSWVGNDISESHLDKYYRMLAIITLSSSFLFTIAATAYELRAKEDRE